MLQIKLGTGFAVVSSLSLVVACGSSGDSGSGRAGSGANTEAGVGGSGSGWGGASSAIGQGGGNGSGNGSAGFPGAGTGFAGDPLAPGVGPDTANDCSTPPPSHPATQVLNQATTCFYGDSLSSTVPAATIEQIIETVNDKTVVHIRITFNPAFVDNTYGANAVGWGTTTTPTAPAPGTGMPAPKPGRGQMPPPPMGGKGGHTFNDLVGSDHVEIELFNGANDLSFHADVDYISQDSSAPCGYATLGVTGGEGKVLAGNASDVLAVATSLSRDLNGCGYCLTQDSPATDQNYTPNPSAPKWDYRVVYELWVDAAAFGSSGFSRAVIYSVHASPSKLSGTNTISVTPKPCPPNWNVPYCVPNGSGEGIDCGSDGGGGAGTGTGADGGGICPPGTVPDLASEGKFCVPV